MTFYKKLAFSLLRSIPTIFLLQANGGKRTIHRFYLLVTAYGAGYLWSGLSTVLHRRPLTNKRFVINAVQRMQELSRKLPDSMWELRREILFYLVFREFLSRYNEKIAQQGGLGMRSWQELANLLACTPLELRCADVEELGFAVGNVIREFSRWYWMSTRSGAEGRGGILLNIG